MTPQIGISIGHGANGNAQGWRLPKYLDLGRIGRRIRVDVGRKISRLGERLNSPALIYNSLIFAHFHWCAAQSAPDVMRILDERFPRARRYLDVGAGTGTVAAAAMARGKTVVAIENSRTARRFARRQRVDIRDFDLNLTPP